MNMISSATTPYLLHTERSGKPRETYGNRFSDALEKEKAENGITESAVEIAVNEMDKARKGEAVSEPSYTVTDEEAEYFREKYGDTYNDDTVSELYNELASKGIISMDDASRSSGTISMIPLSAVKRVVYFGTYLPGRENMSPLRSFSNLTDDVVYIKDISRKDKNAYKDEWDSFKAEYDCDINTWKDALQESLDFERYLKEIAKNSTSGKHYPDQWHFDNVIEQLEKTKDVITRIFGEVTL